MNNIASGTKLHSAFIVSLRMSQLFSYQHLFEFSKAVFLHIGCSDEDALLATNVQVPSVSRFALR